jgi:hypothetical protein
MILSSPAKSFLLVAAVALLMPLPADRSGATPPPRVLGSCAPSKVKFALSSHFTPTASTDPVNITDTAFSFTQARQGCVIVDFTASDDLSDPPPGTLEIGAVLKRSDGATLPGRPSIARVNLAASGFDTRTIQFVFPDVAPGQYVIRMQVDSPNGGGVDVSSPNVVVHYN